MREECEIPGCHRNQARRTFLCKPHLKRVQGGHQDELRMAEELQGSTSSDFELRRVKSAIIADLTDRDLSRPIKAAQRRGRAAVAKGQRGQDQAASAIWKYLRLLAFNPRGKDNVTPALHRIASIEVKYMAAPTIASGMTQAIRDSKGLIPVVLSRKVSATVRHEPWLVTVRLQDQEAWARELIRVMDEGEELAESLVGPANLS